MRSTGLRRASKPSSGTGPFAEARGDLHGHHARICAVRIRLLTAAGKLLAIRFSRNQQFGPVSTRTVLRWTLVQHHALDEWHDCAVADLESDIDPRDVLSHGPTPEE